MGKIYYIGYYTKSYNPNQFASNPSGSNKMGYIISVLKESGRKVDVISLGESKNFNLSKKIKIDDLESVSFISTVGKKNKILSIFARIWLYFQLFVFLVFKTNKIDIVIIYHTFTIMNIVKISRFFKKYKLVYEIEEIYKAAWKASSKEIDKEIRSLNIADAYLFVNDLMYHKFNFKSDLFAVCYGEYNIKSNLKNNVKKNPIIMVYAGAIDGIDSDVYLAIDTVNYLPDNYRLNILGYGSNENIKTLQDYVKSINLNFDNTKVFYDGVMSGGEYIDYLSKCDIGLSTRVLEDYYADFTFPSKVLVYLTNNLYTVSSKISCIVKSKVASSIYFYNESTPESVAEAIKSIDFERSSYNSDFCSLHKSFKNDLNSIINILQQ